MISFSLLSILFLASCNTGSPEGFAVILADTGEVLLSENDIKRYFSENHTLELYEEGIKKWNSHLTYPDIPDLIKN